MVKVKVKPMTDNERSRNVGKVLNAPARFHLIDCLKDLRFGRPFRDQEFLDKCIKHLTENPELGVPFK